MPYLGDYLGQLLSEIAMARAQADMETVRLAELYASHPILKMMPVPHIRLPDVDVDIPVLIKASEEPRNGESARGGVSLQKMKGKFSEVLKAKLDAAGLKPSAQEMVSLNAALDARLEKQGLPAETSVDVNRVADDLAVAVGKVLGAKGGAADSADGAKATILAAELKESSRLEFLKLRAPPPRLSVIVTGSELRELATTENVTRLRLKISEQGVEWTTVETSGGPKDRLVPE
jgi:hypothetical protein